MALPSVTEHVERAPAPVRWRPGTRDWLDAHINIVFILPAALALAGLLVFPLCYTLYMSLFDWFIGSKTPPAFIGLGNYVEMAADPRFWGGLWRTLLYTGLSVSLELIIGTGMALIFARRFFGQAIARTLFLLPMVATPVAMSLIWLLMFDPTLGVLNFFLVSLGLPPSEWASSPNTALLSLVLVDVWQWTPLVMLIALSGLAALPTEPYEAAMIDGASLVQRFFYITLPLLRPYLVVAALFRGIDALKSFDTIYVITKGGPGHASETLTLYAFQMSFDYLHLGFSSAMLVGYFLVALGLSFLLAKYRRSEY
jgi:multiple sugar transport system permease protein